MHLQRIPFDPPARPLPKAVRRLLDDADLRIERLYHDRRDDPLVAFVPCDFVQAHNALRQIAELSLAPGWRFAEWGSGAGVVTLLAALVGFDAVGIEIEPDLVDLSQELATDHEVEAQFVCASFIPQDADHVLERNAYDLGRSIAWLRSGGDDAYELLGEDPEDFDLLFAYPWPGEESVVLDLFAEYASQGALLLTQHGDAELRLHRKK